ncbi:IS66 family insertion sequence element accessory protein TnpB, partial [Psychromonas antarctica]|uniref:IS66 family insertion sequence element accessory protein TnpB n=1 Tax=Psychromonas antarctica TaxID=67573 RepID=UPI001EE7E5E6
MIHLTADTHILLATKPADFRQGIDGLAAVCRSRLLAEPRSGTLFVFINRNKTMIRALAYDGTGFWLMTKRLSTGKFPHWPTSNKVIQPLA